MNITSTKYKLIRTLCLSSALIVTVLIGVSFLPVVHAGGPWASALLHYSATIVPNNQTVRAGTTVDFTGRGFGREESVSVTRSGMLVTTAHADGSGNFSTGSLPVPTTTGPATYYFIGSNTDIFISSTITVVP